MIEPRNVKALETLFSRTQLPKHIWMVELEAVRHAADEFDRMSEDLKTWKRSANEERERFNQCAAQLRTSMHRAQQLEGQCEDLAAENKRLADMLVAHGLAVSSDEDDS